MLSQKHIVFVRIGLLVVVGQLLSGCSTITKYWHDHDSRFDFSRVDSYAFMPRRGGMIADRITSDMVMQRFEIVLEDELSAKQWQLTDMTKADIWVSYYTGTDIENNRRLSRAYYGYDPCWRCSDGETVRSEMPKLNKKQRRKAIVDLRDKGRGDTIYEDSGYVKDRPRALMVIDMVDSHNKRLVWRGYVNSVFKKNHSQQQVKDKLRQLISDLLLEFPPSVASLPSVGN